MRRFVEIDGRRYLWRDLLKLRREQKQGEPEQQLALFELKEDRRPASQVSADGRYASRRCSRSTEPHQGLIVFPAHTRTGSLICVYCNKPDLLSGDARCLSTFGLMSRELGFGPMRILVWAVLGAIGAILAIFVTWGLARAEYQRTKRQLIAQRFTKVALFRGIIREFDQLLQQYVKAVFSNETEAIAFYAKHNNNSQLHAVRDIANLPVTEWPSFASYSTFKMYWFFSLQILQTSNVQPINKDDVKDKLDKHDTWLRILSEDLKREKIVVTLTCDRKATPRREQYLVGYHLLYSRPQGSNAPRHRAGMTMVPTLGGEELLEGMNFQEPHARGRAGTDAVVAASRKKNPSSQARLGFIGRARGRQCARSTRTNIFPLASQA